MPRRVQKYFELNGNVLQSGYATAMLKCNSIFVILYTITFRLQKHNPSLMHTK